MSAADFTRDMRSAIERLRSAQFELERQAKASAVTERKYRVHKAVAMISVTAKTVGEREALAESVIYDNESLGDRRYDRDLAVNLRDSAKEAVRSERQVISALQSLIRLDSEEAGLARYGPREAS